MLRGSNGMESEKLLTLKDRLLRSWKRIHGGGR